MSLAPETYDELRAIGARYPEPRSGLLPMLHLVQSVEGRITPEGIEACAEVLGITAADVSGVATFYTMYKRRPVGDYHVGVCTNTLCAVMGGDAIFERLKDHLDVGNDETTEDGQGQGERHARAHRVQRGLRLRTGDDGQLGVHGQHDARVGRRPGRRPARPAPRSTRPAARGSSPGARPSGCSPASPTTSPTTARPQARPRWSVSASPASAAGPLPRPTTLRPVRASDGVADTKAEAVEQADTAPRRDRDQAGGGQR